MGNISKHSKPVNLIVDWTNPYHRRCMVASLVEEVYRLEYYRLGKRREPEADLATWRDFFNESQADGAQPWRHFFYEPEGNCVIRKDGGSIIGAIYEYKDNTSPPIPNVPRYVVAFRGIIMKLRTIVLGELKSGVQCMLNELERSSRLQLATKAVQDRVASAGAENVWLAGHSLGSAIALYVGKKMAKMGLPLENTYLFNPPFLGVSVEHIKDGKQKKLIPAAVSVLKVAIAGAVDLAGRAVQGEGVHDHQHAEPFADLYNWFPHLFVNQDDPICSGYITYFRNRESMKRNGFGKIERIAAKISITSLFSSDSEALHLLPSAHLTINTGSTSAGFRRAHGIDQWRDPSFSGESKEYNFDGLH